MKDTVTKSGLSRVDFKNEEGEPERILYGVDGKGEFALLLKDARKDKEPNLNYETIVVLRRDFISGWWIAPRWFNLNVGKGGSKTGISQKEEPQAVYLDKEESFAITTAHYKFNQEKYG